MQGTYTPKQGQYLAFIYYYTKLNKQVPAEADFQRYFGTSSPAIHQMIVTLEQKGFIERRPGAARSIRLLIPAQNCQIWSKFLFIPTPETRERQSQRAARPRPATPQFPAAHSQSCPGKRADHEIHP